MMNLEDSHVAARALRYPCDFLFSCRLRVAMTSSESKFSGYSRVLVGACIMEICSVLVWLQEQRQYDACVCV